MKFDSKNARTLADEVIAELQELCQRRGLTVKFKGGKIGAALEVKLEFAFKDATTGVVQDQARADWPTYCKNYGFEPTDLDRTLMNGGVKYKIVGINLRARRQPILIERLSDGKRFKAEPGMVKLALQTAAIYA